MKNIFILIGGKSSGKTTILNKLSLLMYLEKDEFILSTRKGSPQERSEFCHFHEIINKVKTMIKNTDNKINNQKIKNYSLIIPFTLQVKDGILGVDCVVKPLEYLKSLSGYNIHIVHMNRNSKRLKRENDFIKDNLNPELSLNSNILDNQFKNVKILEDFIILKSRTF